MQSWFCGEVGGVIVQEWNSEMWWTKIVEDDERKSEEETLVSWLAGRTSVEEVTLILHLRG